MHSGPHVFIRNCLDKAADLRYSKSIKLNGEICMKVNTGILITSIAMTLVIFGLSIALTTRYGYEIGLPCGLGAFLLLISVMLIINRRLTRKHAQQDQTDKNQQEEEQQ